MWCICTGNVNNLAAKSLLLKACFLLASTTFASEFPRVTSPLLLQSRADYLRTLVSWRLIYKGADFMSICWNLYFLHSRIQNWKLPSAYKWLIFLFVFLTGVDFGEQKLTVPRWNDVSDLQTFSVFFVEKCGSEMEKKPRTKVKHWIKTHHFVPLFMLL